MADSRTIARLEARIKERVAYCVEFELNDPRSTFITVTRVELAKDVSTARIFYSVLGGHGDRTKAARMLESATGFVQRQLGRVLRTRRIPRIQWKYDDTIEYMARMDRAIDDALARDRDINPGAHEGVELDDAIPTEDEVVDQEYEDFLSEADED